MKKKCTADEIAPTQRHSAKTPLENIDPRVESLVNELIGRVADKWTMLILEILAERARCGSPAWANWWAGSARRC